MSFDGWRDISIGEIVKIKHGWSFKGELFSEELTGRPIVVNIGNFQYTGGFRFESTTLREYIANYPKEFELKPADILLVMTCQTEGGEILGIPGRIPDDGRVYLHNQRMGKVEYLQPNLVSPDFIYWVFLWKDFNQHLVETASGTKILHTAPVRIESFRFPLPPKNEQEKIARILGALDDKIELNRRMNQTLEEMVRALFKSWFVDFDPVIAKTEGRVPFGMNAETASLFPAEFEETGEGAIPKGWSISKIGDIANIIDCLHAKKPERQESGKIFLQLNNIRDDSLIDLSDNFYISDDDYIKWTSRLEAREGDCVITNVGRVGAVAQIPPGLSAALGRNMTAIRCKEDFQFPAYLIACLTSDVMREEINTKIDTGTILDALNVKNIPLLKFILAPMPVLSAFEKIVRPLRMKMEMNLNNSQTLATIRDALLPKLLSGELRVKA